MLSYLSPIKNFEVCLTSVYVSLSWNVVMLKCRHVYCKPIPYVFLWWLLGLHKLGHTWETGKIVCEKLEKSEPLVRLGEKKEGGGEGENEVNVDR